jgi:hypothetical protein
LRKDWSLFSNEKRHLHKLFYRLELDYNEINSGTLYQTSPANQGTYSISQLISKVQGIVNNNGYNDVYLGIKNQDESNSSSYVYYLYNVNLQVTYTGNVNVTQLNANGSPFGQVGVWNGSSFDLINVPFSLSRSTNSSLTLKSDQTIKSGPTQKYWQWNYNGQPYVINPHTYTVQSGTNNSDADFKQVYSNVTINITSDGTPVNGTIDFKDPWLINYNDPTYGMRNQGMDAPFVVQSTPFSPTITTNYKGVLLNQSVNSGVYYSIQAPMVQIVNGYASFFSGWISSPSGNATFQNADAALLQSQLMLQFRQAPII